MRYVVPRNPQAHLVPATMETFKGTLNNLPPDLIEL